MKELRPGADSTVSATARVAPATNTDQEKVSLAFQIHGKGLHLDMTYAVQQHLGCLAASRFFLILWGMVPGLPHKEPG